MINWFVAGHELPNEHWYFHEAEGGRVLGNLCHWTDLTLHLVGFNNAFPCTVSSTSPPHSKSDFVFSVVFADQSCAVISFSAKGHTFEGVREVLNVHRGDLIASLSDFQRLTIEIGHIKIHHNLRYRDHGHRQNILNSFTSSTGEYLDVIFMTASFFLAFKSCLDTGLPVVVERPSSF
jgi:predicted dehydrogenase